MNFQIIAELINQYNSIVIYRHINPDSDAAGATFALKNLILDNFPGKEVYAYGTQNSNNILFPANDEIGARTIYHSLAFVLDCSTIERVDDNTFLNAQEIVSIDHHFNGEHMSKYEFVDDQACSTCFLIAKMAFELNWKISKKVANYLYAGILTDTVKLTIDKVNEEVMNVVGKLLTYGANIKEINRICYDIDVNAFKARNYFLNKTIFSADTAYFYCEKKEREELNISAKTVKNFIDSLSDIVGVNKYFIFCQSDDLTYEASLRSHKVPIVQIAQYFGGGGHALACGVKGLTLQQTLELTKMMVNTK